MSSIKTPIPVNTVAAVIPTPISNIPVQFIVFTTNQETIYIISCSKLKLRSSSSVVQCSSFVVLCNRSPHRPLSSCTIPVKQKQQQQRQEQQQQQQQKKRKTY